MENAPHSLQRIDFRSMGKESQPREIQKQKTTRKYLISRYSFKIKSILTFDGMKALPFFAAPQKKENSMTNLTREQIDGAISFHGHHCPGLTIGLRAAEFCLREIGNAKDEEIVAVVENDMCAVDAVQFLTGCTFGKGNFIFRDYGKAAFTFFRRSDDKRFRIILNPTLCADLRSQMENVPRDSAEGKALRQKMIERLMEAELDEMFNVSIPDEPIPGKARLHKTIACARCGEGTMETRLSEVNGQLLCRTCAKN